MRKIEYIETLNVGNVSFSDPFLGKYLDKLSDKMIPYQWKMINDDEKSGIIHDFRVAAGDIEGRHLGMVFQDEGLFKWIESASYSLAQKPDEQIKKWVDYTIDLVERAQQEDGYLLTYFMLNCPDKEFKNLLESHELLCLGNILEAGVAHYEATNETRLLNVAIRLADFLYHYFLEEPEHFMLVGGHPGVELGLIKMYRTTKNEKYLELAKHFVDVRGKDPDVLRKQHDKEWNRPNIFRDWDNFGNHTYMQIHQPVREQETAEGHAVRASYLYSAMMDVYMETGDESLFEACKKIYRNLVGKRMYITGGVGSACCGERFTADYDLPNDTIYAESCASVALALFSRRMFQATGEGIYIDYAEQALYNTVLASVALDGEHYFYVNPLETWPEVSYKNPTIAHVKPTRQGWYQVACCPQNTLRTLASWEQYTCLKKDNTLYCCMYADSTIDLQLTETKVKLQVSTRYPFENEVAFKIEIDAEFTLALRNPYWSEHTKVLINKEAVEEGVDAGFIYLKRDWKAGDVVTLILDMKPEFIISHPKLRANSGKLALKKGPLVYCIEEADNGENLRNYYVSPNAQITEVYDKDIFGGCLTLQVPAVRLSETLWEDQEPEWALYQPYAAREEAAVLTAVPYCFWNNRGEGEMLVWINRY